MDSSTKRKVGAIALIVAGIGAFLVPFLLHSPGLQASNNGGGNTNSNNNNGSNTCTSNCTPPSTCTTNCSTDKNPGGSGSGPGSGPCTADTGKDSGDNDNQGKHLAKGQDGDQGGEGKHLALGHDNQNSQAASLVSKAQGFMHALGKHNPQHDATHSTKTDNHTVKNNTAHSDIDDTDQSSCVNAASNDDSDDQGNDD